MKDFEAEIVASGGRGKEFVTVQGGDMWKSVDGEHKRGGRSGKLMGGSSALGGLSFGGGLGWEGRMKYSTWAVATSWGGAVRYGLACNRQWWAQRAAMLRQGKKGQKDKKTTEIGTYTPPICSPAIPWAHLQLLSGCLVASAGAGRSKSDLQ